MRAPLLVMFLIGCGEVRDPDTLAPAAALDPTALDGDAARRPAAPTPAAALDPTALDGDAARRAAGPAAGPATRAIAAPPPPISTVLADCGAPGEVGGVRAGADLQRVNLDLAAFPDARCNDGTGATFFFRPSATAAGRTRWVIELQGGGGCRTPEACAQRWCSLGTNFGIKNMSSSLLPAASMAAGGILSRNPAVANPLADANHVFVPYCTSDTHAGHTGKMTVSTAHPVTGVPVQFAMEFQGQAVLDAVVSTLRRAGAAPPPFTLGGGSIALADLDDAREVVIAGASAGGGGVINNVDRLGAVLRANNAACGGAVCPLRYRALVDSTFGPSNEALDWSTSTACATAGLCTWEAVLTAGTSMYPTASDASCEAWHAANAPATAYLCHDTDHVLVHHVTTPFFVRQGLRDQLISDNAIDSGVSVPGQGPMTLARFATLVRDRMLALATLPATAEEGAAIATTPGAFGPPCVDHDTLSSDAQTFGVQVQAAGAPRTMFDAYTSWLGGGALARVVYAPGDPAVCP